MYQKSVNNKCTKKCLKKCEQQGSQKVYQKSVPKKCPQKVFQKVSQNNHYDIRCDTAISDCDNNNDRDFPSIHFENLLPPQNLTKPIILVFQEDTC